MAMPTCVKCGNHTFEVKETEPRNSNYKLMFVQCTSCGGVVGVMDYFNIGTFVKKIADKLGIR